MFHAHRSAPPPVFMLLRRSNPKSYLRAPELVTIMKPRLLPPFGVYCANWYKYPVTSGYGQIAHSTRSFTAHAWVLYSQISAPWFSVPGSAIFKIRMAGRI